MNVQILWPTPLFTHDFTESQLDAWRTRAKTMLLPDEQLLNRYGHRPWCTTDLLHEDPVWADMASAIMDIAHQALDSMAILREDAYITTMWINAQYQQSNHTAHTHPNSILSGCLYLQAPKHSQHIRFFDPRPQTGVMCLRRAIVEDHVAVNPVEGRVLMWPSWLLHSTESNSSHQLAEPRISVGFNVMVKDTIHDHSSKIRFGY